MLANISDTPSFSGSLNSSLHAPATFLHELLDFIRQELPAWRDDPKRPQETSETTLTSHLSSHLESAARKSSGWDILQFKTEVPDEKDKRRSIDLAPAPCNTDIIIEGRTYNKYDILMPIECKRFPTPKGTDRDERESEARALFIGLALHVFETEEEPTIGAINRLLGAEADLGDICRQIIKTHEELPSSIVKPLNNFANKAAKERSGVKTSINEAMNLWDNPTVDSATSKSDFDISKIRKERSTIYVSVGTEEIETLAPLLRIFFEQTIKTLVRKEPSEDEPHQILLVMDEFHMLGSMEVMKTAFTLLAGYNVRIIGITQSLSWLETSYDRATRNGILSCCAHQIFFAANDEDTKSYVSNACGERTISIESTSQRNSFSYEPQTRNISFRTVPLITKQEMHNLDKSKEIILVEAGLPIKADKIKYYEDKLLSERANLQPSFVPDLDIIEKAIPEFDIPPEGQPQPPKPDPNQTNIFDKMNSGNPLDLNGKIKVDDEAA